MAEPGEVLIATTTGIDFITIPMCITHRITGGKSIFAVRTAYTTAILRKCVSLPITPSGTTFIPNNVDTIGAIISD